MAADIPTIAGRLMAAQDAGTTLPLITASAPDFSLDDAYRVLAEIERRRRDQGWRSVGRKIGFTNRNIWPRYGVYQPNWAHMWASTVHFAKDGKATLPLRSFVQPRIEPEVIFKLRAPIPTSDDPVAVLSAVEWIAPGFEIVHSHFADWKFAAPDCTALCALHGALVVGAPRVVTDANRATLAASLPSFTVTLSRGDAVIEQDVGSNVLGSPALALAYLSRLVAAQPQFPPIAAGEIITTGTLTDARPVNVGETWSADFGALGVDGLSLSFVEPR